MTFNTVGGELAQPAYSTALGEGVHLYGWAIWK